MGGDPPGSVEVPLRRSGEPPAGLGPSVEVRAPIVVRVSPRPILTGHGPPRRRGVATRGKYLAAAAEHGAAACSLPEAGVPNAAHFATGPAAQVTFACMGVKML